MSEETNETIEDNLHQGLNESFLAHKRQVTVRHLSERRHLTLGQIAKLVANPEHGGVIASIRLDEILGEASEAGDSPEPSAGKKTAKKAPSSAKKATVAPSSGKKAAKKAPSSGKKAAKKAPSSGKAATGTATAGKGKARLNYDVGCREVLAVVKAAKDEGHESVSLSGIVEATGLPLPQARAFVDRLRDEHKLKTVGPRGRLMAYALT